MKKRVLFIVWSYSYGGGAEKILNNVINNMDESKYEVDVLECCKGSVPLQDKPHIRKFGPIIDETHRTFPESVKQFIFFHVVNRCPQLVRKLVFNRKYDIEISFNYCIPSFLLDYNNPNLYCWIHGSVEDLHEAHVNRECERNVFKKAKKIVAISDKTMNSLIDVFPEFEDKYVFIENGYNFEQMMEMSKVENTVNSKPFDLMYCNRLDDNKNPLRLLEILYSLKKKGYIFTLGMLGSGHLENQVKEKIKEYGLEDQVMLFGYQTNPYMFMKQAKVMCLSSHAEGFPTVLIEGMYFGLPFVTTEVGGAKEMCNENKNGFIAHSNEEYENYLIELMTNSNTYETMQMNCKEFVMNYSISRQIEKLERMIENE